MVAIAQHPQRPDPPEGLAFELMVKPSFQTWRL